MYIATIHAFSDELLIFSYKIRLYQALIKCRPISTRLRVQLVVEPYPIWVLVADYPMFAIVDIRT